jgi:type IV pilus assembly protein PilA
MLQKLRNTNEKGFTLIELMIVIAIIGILAAIAIPNFISYRNKGFCSAAERDAGSIGAALANYFSNPNRTGLPASGEELGLTLSSSSLGENTSVISGDTNTTVTIRVTDVSTRCPEGSAYVTTLGGVNGYWD